MYKTTILGSKVDIMNRKEAIGVISEWCEEKYSGLKQVVTAYSEFFVTARRDPDFQRIVNDASLVTPDGISVLAAERYVAIAKNKPAWQKFLLGLKVGGMVLSGALGEPVTGVKLFTDLIKVAREKKYKVFFLGGFENTAQSLAEKLRAEYSGLLVQYDAGGRVDLSGKVEEKINEQVIDRINKFKPDLLMVAYGPVKQEKWIAANRDRLIAKVAIGLGGTFDELTGRVRPVPKFLERMGLKWLGRLLLEPKRLGRMWQAFPVFPWLVFRESLKE